ncbi:MAG: hypothetical protein KJ955_06380 [Nanoarchaeota archaeon]|nr:hypothetical protein [Nanoarchaeota archaeon]
MEFREMYQAFVVSEGRVGTMEEVGREFIAEYHSLPGSTGERFVQMYGKLEDAFRENGSESKLLNLECFASCNDLLRMEALKLPSQAALRKTQEAGRK